MEVADINDNAPTFPRPTFHHRISESVRVGFSFVVPSAHDSDSVANSVKFYRIVSPTPLPFRLERRISDVSKNVAEVRLVVKDELDREVVDRYEFQLLAVDGGSHKLSGSLNVTVVVVDANDHTPLFDRSTYEIWLQEDIPVGSLLQKLHATDEDAGANGKVSYHLEHNSLQEYGDVVDVFSSSGEVYLKKRLDYETGSKMVVKVVATDAGSSPLQSTAVLIVHVIDVNDNHPNISANTLTPQQRASIFENAQVRLYVKL